MRLYPALNKWSLNVGTSDTGNPFRSCHKITMP